MTSGPRQGSPDSEDWRPTASLDTMRMRARLLAQIRAFFSARDVLEVETPLLSSATVTDPHLHSLTTVYQGPGAPEGRILYLQTSPEFAMKRLLAAGSGPIFQICRAFRNQEAGWLHNPEFTLLEWYRPGFDHHALMDEVDGLLAEVLTLARAERLSYGAAFRGRFGLDPLDATTEELRRAAISAGLRGISEADRDGWLDLMMSHSVQPTLGRGRPTFLYDYPPSQAALARVRPGPPAVAERFEVFVEGLEIGNGFHELADAAEQRRRLEADVARRRALGLEAVPVDERLLRALAQGLPDCAGVAIGVDRLLMVAAGIERGSIDQVLSFPWDRA
jgi:lysyl-tRNA synthetase class 2